MDPPHIWYENAQIIAKKFFLPEATPTENNKEAVRISSCFDPQFPYLPSLLYN